MLNEAVDFRHESDTLHELLSVREERDFSRVTQFKGWTVDDVLTHLHAWNLAADWSLHDPERFEKYMLEVSEAQGKGETHLDVSYRWIQRVRGIELVRQWHALYQDMACRFEYADPQQRVKWAGPDMTVAMSITARQMETWSHGQALFDLFDVEREEHDRIRNIVVLGVMTFGWTFAVRNLERPQTKPYLSLTAPSGIVWTWNEPSETNRIDGLAVEFAQVVTQVRNIEDTDLRSTGDSALQWMSMAQCFAGPPEAPPAPGTRFRAASA